MDKNEANVLEQSIQAIKGIGSSRAALFNKLGIYTLGDLVTFFPREYEDRSIAKDIGSVENGQTCSIKGVIESDVMIRRPRRGLSIQKINIKVDSRIVTVTWFNKDYLKNAFKKGEAYYFHGTVKRGTNRLEFMNPVYESVLKEAGSTADKIVPIYPLTSRLSQNVIRDAVKKALDISKGYIPETIPDNILKKYGLLNKESSICSIHFPKNSSVFEQARNRLVFEELFIMQILLAYLKNSDEIKADYTTHKKVPKVYKIINELPFELTNSQLNVFKEIEKDMERPAVMNRLVQGDVGCGKTIVAFLALYKAVKSGYQGIMMAPTEILALQHYKHAKELLDKYGVETALITAGIARDKRKETQEAVEKGDIDIVIGTHALLTDKVTFKTPGLVITDEQHRFGVRQRAVLSQKGTSPDMLVMTATPIPRTLALILYGDLDISIIDEMPAGRIKVKTYVVREDMRPRINAFIRKNVQEGRQVFIVCPLVEESENIDAQSVDKLADKIASNEFKDLRVGLLHGRLKAVEKEQVMKEFYSGKIDILVSTTVIEVGMDIPNAALMVVENAERFGLAQLHQLRGRVGRGKHQSYCILYNGGDNEKTSKRLKVMENNDNGFIIAEKDLQLRGAGELFGLRQHGLPEFKIANLYRDTDVLKQAQQAVQDIIQEDRMLEKHEQRQLKNFILDKYKDKLSNISLN
jgi:ATP-dependent DNA helicase RecG